ncbi:MAG: type II toxin-antitoxin system Phd/YefM family antitoxin [Dehalococcoidia bacterium]
MIAISVSDIEQNLAAYLGRVEAGEIVLILRDGEPVAELRPVATEATQPRPYGLAAGDFAVPDDFDAPLAVDVFTAFA